MTTGFILRDSKTTAVATLGTVAYDYPETRNPLTAPKGSYVALVAEGALGDVEAYLDGFLGVL